MKNFLIITILLLFVNNIKAIDIDADLFSYDEKKVEAEFKELSKIEALVNDNPQATIEELVSIYPEINKIHDVQGFPFYNNTEITEPGKFPSFWFTFACSAVGTYFIYGVVAAPISTGIVYFSAHKDKVETKKAIWGCVSGTLVGAGVKLLTLNL